MSDNPTKQPNRIPFESITTMERWSLPRVGEGQATVAAEKKAAKGKTANKAEDTKGERIEDVTGPVSHKPMTAEQLNEITEAAEKEGYQAGFDKGYEEGLQQGQQKGAEEGRQQAYQATFTGLEEERSRLYQIAHALMVPLEQQDQAVEKLVVDMAMGLAKHLLQQQLSVDASALYGVVSQALQALPMGSANIRIYLHPEDLAAAESLFENDKGRGWQFMPDSKLLRGGCRVETTDSVVDYSVERRLKDFLAAVEHNGEVAADSVEPVAEFGTPASADASLDTTTDSLEQGADDEGGDDHGQ